MTWPKGRPLIVLGFLVFLLGPHRIDSSQDVDQWQQPTALLEEQAASKMGFPSKQRGVLCGGSSGFPSRAPNEI